MALDLHTVELLAPTTPARLDRILLGFRANVPIPGRVGAITETQINERGSGYIAVPTITTIASAGSLASLAALMEVNTVTNVSTGTGYQPGDLITLAGGTGTSAVIEIDHVKLLSTSQMVTGGAAGYLVGDQITLGGGGSQAQPHAIINVATTTGAGVPATYSIGTAGVFSTTGATLVQIGTTGLGTGVTVTATYGAVDAVINIGGLYSALPTVTGTTQSSASGIGTGATWATTYDVADITITSGGTGYVPPVTLGFTAAPAGGVTAEGSATTDTAGAPVYIPLEFDGLPVDSTGLGTYAAIVTGQDDSTIFSVVSKDASGFTVVANSVSTGAAPGGTFDVLVVG